MEPKVEESMLKTRSENQEPEQGELQFDIRVWNPVDLWLWRNDIQQVDLGILHSDGQVVVSEELNMIFGEIMRVGTKVCNRIPLRPEHQLQEFTK
ncbi:hypothetical protein WICPIJ_005944 [Wickerhamomyces pijperi]|uniref:Uncharacterized protein n=1 Tax=Wickerhamomyces pijperi TaxID=599730 RepID=A0A9P8TLB8_WICPI|nr:hypothetical protein WICPIJ_005944 [Wickerhamomyces pijperi]